jgi:hypothetical protein
LLHYAQSGISQTRKNIYLYPSWDVPSALSLRYYNSVFKIFVFLQILASVAPNIMLFDLCMSTAFTTVLIGASLNANTGLSINENEASWIGEIQATLAQHYTG